MTITANYAAADVVLAYATTIAGAQGRTTDRSYVLVTPRTTAQSLYVGMTRGRESNTAHVVCDTHDHEELRLGERSPRDAFVAAMQRDPDGSLSAHTIAERWHDQFQARDAARRADRKLQEVAHLWNISRRSLAPAIHHARAGDEESIVRALARLGSNSERVAAISAAKRVLTRPGATVDQFVATLTSPPRPRTESTEVPNIGSSAARSPNRTRKPKVIGATLYRKRYSGLVDVGAIIRDFRVRHGLTQSELGRLSSVPQPVLSAYEHGRRVPTLDTLEAILAVRGETVVVELAQAQQHDRSVARTIEIHRMVLDKLLDDPDRVLGQAATQLEVINQVANDRNRPYLDAWRALLEGPRADLVRVLMSTAEADVELLKLSPFAGLLTDDERAEVARRALRRRALAS